MFHTPTMNNGNIHLKLSYNIVSLHYKYNTIHYNIEYLNMIRR